jgi:hypothetical protein
VRSAAGQGPPGREVPIDEGALLCALVLAPGAWSRNRFYGVFEDPKARRARRRAAHVRSVIAGLRKRGPEARDRLPPAPPSGEDVELVLEMPELGAVRRTRLSALELALVRYALRGAAAAPDDPDRERVERALGKLI